MQLARQFFLSFIACGSAHRFLFGCILLAWCIAGAAAPPRTLRFDQLSVEQGLAQEIVTVIAQDRRGFMWFGSQNGLSRFDGYRVTIYKNIPNDARSLGDNWIECLYLDDKGRLWIGTRGGLQRYDAGSDSFMPLLRPSSTNPALKRQVLAITGDGQGKLWLATDDGLQRFDPDTEKFTAMRHDPADGGSLQHDSVTALARDAKGNLWVGMKTGIDLLAPGAAQFRHFKVESSNQDSKGQHEVQSLLADRDGSLWVATPLGLENWQFDGDAVQKHRFGPAEALHAGLVTAMYQDRDATLWIGTNTSGLLRWDIEHRQFVAYPNDPRAAGSKEVASLYQDRSGTLWVGTWTAGVKHVDLFSGGFSRFFHVQGETGGLSDNRVYGLADDGQGRLWLATFGGLDRLDPAKREIETFRRDAAHGQGFPEDAVVISLLRDSRAQLWAGTGSGLGRFDPASGRFAPLYLRTGDPGSDSITHIASDRAGLLWITSHGGLHRLDPASDSVRTFRHDAGDAASLADNSVRMALEDSRGALWIATDSGLDRLDRASGRFTHFRHDPNDASSLGNDRIQYLFEDSHGTLWVGSSGGLHRVEPQADGSLRFHAYTTRQGLAADSIGGILEDGGGALWISTTAGISRFDPVAETFRNYTAHDGMIEGYYFVGSALRDRDGTMYFGGVNGLTVFRPEAIRDNPMAPSIAITDIEISGRPVAAGAGIDGVTLDGAVSEARELTMSYRHSVFSFAFSALHYADPQRNRYAYQLQGFDKDWVMADAGKRSTTYTNLDPGRYVFRVKAANKDGVWNAMPASLIVTITPPYWQTWWFRLAMGALLLAAIRVAYRARIRSLTEQTDALERQVMARTSEVVQQKEIVEHKNTLLEHQKRQLQSAQQQLQRYLEDRERLFISISHDLRTPITRLKLRSELLDDDTVREEFHDDLDELDMMVKGALQCVKDSDIHENPTEVRLDALINRMIRGAQLAGHSVQYAESGLSVIAKPLALKRAIGNLLDNALHYGERVEISVREDDGWIEIRIRDHGPGVAEEAFESLFQSYVRLEHGRDRNESGMGLGLGIARGIVEAHGGQLILENHPQGGLVATIRLPKK